MKKSLIYSTVMLLAIGCSSSKKEEEAKPQLKEVDNSSTIKRDYEVRDASSVKRPTWVEDVQIWAKDTGKDIDKYSFFSYATEPKTSREIACKLAKANAKNDIAGEIATFIQSQLGESQEGKASIDPANPETQPMREFVETTLAQQVQALIHGASVRKTYWEKRHYQQNLGAVRDYYGFTCSVLVRMDSNRLSRLINKAEQLISEQSDDPSTKENVKKALKDVSKNFIKARKGEI